MDRERFYYLFVNANCIAELALNPSESELDALLAETTPAPVQDTDAAVAAGFEGLDMDALDGLAFFGDDDIAADAFPETDAGNGGDDGQRPHAFDIDRYMENAYSYEETLRERVDAAYLKADLVALQRLLDRTTTGLCPITERQSGSHMQQWLDLYKSDEDTITELVVRIRQLAVA